MNEVCLDIQKSPQEFFLQDSKIYKDFDIFSRALMSSKDIDPDYLVIKELGGIFDLNPEWYVFCYLNYYDIYSGLKLYSFFPTPESWNEKEFRKINNETKFNYCRERKGNSRIVDVQVRAFKEFLNFYFSQEFQLSLLDAERMRNNIMSIYNQGAMIAYKYIEVLQKSFDRSHLTPPDCNMKNYSDGIKGTRGAFGVKFLYNLDYQYDKKTWIPVWENFASKLAKAYGTDAGEIETCFCKFAKLCKGNYYLGYDIWEHYQLESLVGGSEYKKIMSKHFDERWWKDSKLYKEYLPLYKQTGKLIWCDEFLKENEEVDIYNVLIDNL